MSSRSISISTEVFAAIWARRAPGEDDENQILRRILATAMPQSNEGVTRPIKQKLASEGDGKMRWVDDVVSALRAYGGTATLAEIYKKTIEIRKESGRSLPPTTEATIRRTIEDHSSDSANYRGTNVFTLVRRGVWSLR